MNSLNGFVSNMIGVAAIAAHTIPLRSGLTSKQVRRDSDCNLDCCAVSRSAAANFAWVPTYGQRVLLFRNTITQLIEN